MFNDLLKSVEAFRNSKSIGVFCKEITNLDKTMSIITISRLCKKENKTFELICLNEIKNNYKKYLVDEGIEILNSPRSKNYVVSIDYSSTNIEKVVCNRDESTNKLNFVITPGDELFTFDNVDLISGGTNFDLIFSFGLKDITGLEDNVKEVFNDSKIISITKKEGDLGDFKFLINEDKSYSEVVLEFAKGFSKNLSEEIFNPLLKGVIGRYRLGESSSPDGWLLAGNLIKYGADLEKAFKEIYYKKDNANFNLQKTLMSDVKIDGCVALSKVDIKDMSFSDLDVRGKILFNISQDFDIVVAVYIKKDKDFKVVIESNDIEIYSAIDFAQLYNGIGNKKRAVFSVKDVQKNDFSREFLENFKKVFDITIQSFF